MEDKQNFCEWFNPDDIDHLHAYHSLQETGRWPYGFIPKNIHMNSGWQFIIVYKMADKWIDYKLSQFNSQNKE